MREQRPDLFIAEAVEQTVDVLMRIYGEDQIAAAALYGSAAKGNFVRGLSDINLFVVIKLESAGKLVRAAEAFSGLLEQYRIKLMMMTEVELQESADMFPLEFLEIRETQKVVAGDDLLSALPIDRSHYRHQAEERLRGSITMLRQLILMSGSRKRLMLEQFLIWCGKQDTLFRSLIRLRDEQRLHAAGAEAGPRVAEAVAELYEVDQTILQEIYTVRDQPKMADLSREHLAQILLVYESLAHTVNNL